LKRWLPLVTGVLLISGVLATAGFIWLHHMYTVGIDVNLKALAVLAAAIAMACGIFFLVARAMRKRRS